MIHPTHQLATGPHFPASMNDQKYRPPETGKAEDSSPIASPTRMVTAPVNTQLQMSTTGPPYSSPWLYRPVKHSIFADTSRHGDIENVGLVCASQYTCDRCQRRHYAETYRAITCPHKWSLQRLSVAQLQQPPGPTVANISGLHSILGAERDCVPCGAALTEPTTTSNGSQRMLLPQVLV